MERRFELVRSGVRGSLGFRRNNGLVFELCSNRLTLWFEGLETCATAILILSTEPHVEAYAVRTHGDSHLIVQGQESREYVWDTLVCKIDEISEEAHAKWVYLSVEYDEEYEEEVDDGHYCSHCSESRI